MESKNRIYNEIKFNTESSTDLESLVSVVNIEGQGSFMWLHFNGEIWEVAISLKGLPTVVQLRWEDFVNIFQHFSVFIADEAYRMLEQRSQDAQADIEELQAKLETLQSKENDEIIEHD